MGDVCQGKSKCLSKNWPIAEGLLSFGVNQYSTMRRTCALATPLEVCADQVLRGRLGLMTVHIYKYIENRKWEDTAKEKGFGLFW